MAHSERVVYITVMAIRLVTHANVKKLKMEFVIKIQKEATCHCIPKRLQATLLEMRHNFRAGESSNIS